MGESLQPGPETPFTDYRVEERDGLPGAVFDRLPPEQGSLLSYFLYPDKAYAGALYVDVLKVAAGRMPWMSYEDDFFKTTLRPDCVELETKEPDGRTGNPVRVRLSLDEAKYLLLKWGFECMRWEAVREDPPGVGPHPDQIESGTVH